MPPTYVYGKTKDIETIEQKLLPDLTGDNPIFSIFPFDSDRRHMIEWEQEDNYGGLQQLRGYNGLPLSVQLVGSKRYKAEPGVYGEHVTLDEEELSIRRERASYGGGPVDVRDLVGRAVRQLLVRRLNLVKKICWNLLVNGTFSVSHKISGVSYTGSYTPPTFTPNPLWNQHATATPLKDMRGYKAYGVGQSCSFGAAAVQYMNWVTAEEILSNTNPDDLGGKLLGGGNTVNSLADVNKILLMNDVPPIKIHDDGYIDDNGTWQYDIPTGKAVVVGKRPSGARVGRYRYTININSPNSAAKPYTRVFDRSTDQVPGLIEVHDGHNGGPLVQFPGSVIVVNAYTP